MDAKTSGVTREPEKPIPCFGATLDARAERSLHSHVPDMRLLHPINAFELAAIALLAAGAAALLTASCAATAPRKNCKIEDLVVAREVAALRACCGDDLVVFDVRERTEYDAGHLDGALSLPYAQWEQLSLSAESGLSHDQAWIERIGGVGVDGDDCVLVYDGGKMTQAARVWFVLQHFGVENVAVIDGGFPSLQRAAAEGACALSTASATRAPANFTPNSRGEIGLVERDALKRAIEHGEVQVLDVRSRAEFIGEDLRKNARGGHLPTAVNLPHNRLLDEQGQLLPIAELQRLLHAAGCEPGRPLVTHCDGGGRAALAALAAARAGYGPVLNYYLSFGDWAKDSSCPVVKD